jgi:ribosome maturation protein SDO1
MSKNIVVKWKHNNITLEVLVKHGTMKPYREGKMKLDNALAVEEIFTNASKFDKAKASDIKKCCETDNKMDAIKMILDKGEFPLNKEELQELVNKKRGEILNYLHKYYQDPRPENVTPHPVQRFEGVLDDLKVRIDPYMSLEQQIRPLIKKIQEVLPIKPMNPPHEMLLDEMASRNKVPFNATKGKRK